MEREERWKDAESAQYWPNCQQLGWLRLLVAGSSPVEVEFEVDGNLEALLPQDALGGLVLCVARLGKGHAAGGRGRGGEAGSRLGVGKYYLCRVGSGSAPTLCAE